MTTVPPTGTSRVCPACGSRRSREAKLKPGEIFVVVRDRQCKDCGTVYTPPTPAWAAYGLLVGGAVVAGTGVFFIAMVVYGLVTGEARRSPVPVRIGQAVVAGVVLAGFGGWLFRYGVRMLSGAKQ